MIYTYFITDGVNIKIGRSKDPKKRLASLQTGYPTRLEILSVVRGDCEADCHELLKDHRLGGEWFDMSALLKSFYLWCVVTHSFTNDIRGDLAQDMREDRTFPVTWTCGVPYAHFMQKKACLEAIRACEICFREWRLFRLRAARARRLATPNQLRRWPVPV